MAITLTPETVFDTFDAIRGPHLVIKIFSSSISHQFSLTSSFGRTSSNLRTNSFDLN